MTFEEVQTNRSVMLMLEAYFRKQFVGQLRQQHFEAIRRLQHAERELQRLKESRINTTTSNNIDDTLVGRMRAHRQARQHTEDDTPRPQRRLTEAEIQNV